MNLDDSFLTNLTVFIKGALIFVVSQAWNSAMQDFISRTKFFDEYGKLLYALLVTVFAVYVLKLLSNIGKILVNCRDTINRKCLRWFRFF